MIRIPMKEVPTISIRDAKSAHAYLMKNCFKKDEMYREKSFLVFLNNANEILGDSLLSLGGMNCTAIDIEIATKLSIMAMASKVILAHNHPSGHPAPSKSDLEQTGKLKKILGCCDIQLVDHIIVTEDQFYSFAEEMTYKA